MDSLVRIQTYQWVTMIFREKNFLARFPGVRNPERERSLWPMRKAGLVMGINLA